MTAATAGSKFSLLLPEVAMVERNKKQKARIYSFLVLPYL